MNAEYQDYLERLAQLDSQITDIEKTPISDTRETFTDGLIDLDCRVRVFATAPDKKAIKVLHRRLNPDRTAKRALANCGTNPKFI